MMTLRTPVVSVFVGEGGSGGALALAVADEVWMMENACYSVISPEGCASILWKDSSKVREAAQCLKMTADDLFQLGAIERIIPESEDFGEVYGNLKEELYKVILQKKSIDKNRLLQQRYDRFRKFGAQQK